MAHWQYNLAKWWSELVVIHCDLSPLDVWMVGYLEIQIYTCEPTTTKYLKDNIRYYINEISAHQSNTVVRNFAEKRWKRLTTCFAVWTNYRTNHGIVLLFVSETFKTLILQLQRLTNRFFINIRPTIFETKTSLSINIGVYKSDV